MYVQMNDLSGPKLILANAKALDRLRRALRATARLCTWARRCLETFAPGEDTVEFYTYWLGPWTLGLGLALRGRHVQGLGNGIGDFPRVRWIDQNGLAELGGGPGHLTED